MPSNADLLACADFILSEEASWQSAKILARHVRDSLSASADEGPVDDAWLESIGRGEFTHDGFYFCVSFNYEEVGEPYLMWRPEDEVAFEAWPFPLKSRKGYLSLLSALGIETTS